jgi:hypothetical protein
MNWKWIVILALVAVVVVQTAVVVIAAHHGPKVMQFRDEWTGKPN